MSKRPALVLGCGMIGSAIAMDLARRGGWDVTVADRDERRLAASGAKYGVRTLPLDVSDSEAIRHAAASAVIVLNALPSVIAYRAMQGILEAGVPAVGISFMTEDSRGLDELARVLGHEADT